jgi:hypothetical protein
MKTEADFEAAVAKAPESIRDQVYAYAWQNSFAVEVFNEYADDAERWEVAVGTAEMMIDYPEGYGIKAE